MHFFWSFVQKVKGSKTSNFPKQWIFQNTCRKCWRPQFSYCFRLRKPAPAPAPPRRRLQPLREKLFLGEMHSVFLFGSIPLYAIKHSQKQGYVWVYLFLKWASWLPTRRITCSKQTSSTKISREVPAWTAEAAGPIYSAWIRDPNLQITPGQSKWIFSIFTGCQKICPGALVIISALQQVNVRQVRFKVQAHWRGAEHPL